MYTPDDIGAIIRVHYEIDQALQHVIGTLIPFPKRLKLRYMKQRIELLLALGMPEVRLQPAEIVNHIRNDFAHRDKETFLAEDVTGLHEAIVALYGREIPPTFAMLHRKDDGSTQEWRYCDMNLKEKFCFLGSFALGGVATIQTDFHKIAIRQVVRFSE